MYFVQFDFAQLRQEEASEQLYHEIYTLMHYALRWAAKEMQRVSFYCNLNI